MRLGNLDGRAVLVSADGSHAVDVATVSEGRFGPDPQHLFTDWPAFAAWARAHPVAGPETGAAFRHEDLGPPVPGPSQIFAIGLNYRAHAAEVGADLPEQPVVFTKFASSLTGPMTQVVGCPTMDWEVELVVVIGVGGRHLPVESAWAHVAGLTVGNDLSHRGLQGAGPAPQQWSLAKSLPGFGPTGPWLVTPEELAERDDLAVECRVNGRVVQASRTSDLIFGVPQLIAHLSGTVELRPGDLIFTGTPAGVAVGRPDRPWLVEGDEVITSIEGIGRLRQRIVAAP